MRATLLATLVLVGAACQSQPPTIAAPPSPLAGLRLWDSGFFINPRPACSAEVIAASHNPDLGEIKRLADAGAVFTCGSAGDPLPLDDAVMRDDPARVIALLEAHADPTARWSSHGDRFPLQEAIEAVAYGQSVAHRSGIIRILLAHGADPNQRWCPFESRVSDGLVPGCISAYGVTPLIWAAEVDDAGITFLLLQAGADPELENQLDANAFDLAHGEAVFFQLASAVSVRTGGKGADLLADLAKRQVRSTFEGPWDETPLTRAIIGGSGAVMLPPAPSPSPASAGEPIRGNGPSRIPPPRYRSLRVGRVKGLLTLGANANARLTWGGVDWTPLALAIQQRDDEIVRVLFRSGADPNARWCVPVTPHKAPNVYRPEPGCTAASGVTPLMFAASLGDLNVLGALLEHFAINLELRDWNGKTAADYGERAGHSDAVYELQRATRLRNWVRRYTTKPSGK